MWFTGFREGTARLLATAVMVAAPLAASAQEPRVGEQEYLYACASCHGEAGTGSGSMAEYLTVAPPALTGLAAANNGEFPMLEVIQIIDGRSGVRGHGEDGMPVWGAVYANPMAAEVGPIAAEIATRGRILSLALYLESLQE